MKKEFIIFLKTFKGGCMDKGREVLKVLIIVLLLNLSVSIVKILVGLITGMNSILSDGIHSFSDAAINIMGVVSSKIASRPPDERHPYGYEKYETIATNIIIAICFLLGFNVMKDAFIQIFKNVPKDVQHFSLGYFTLVFTIVINIITAIYEGRKGKKLNSEFLIADSTETKSDIFVSLGVMIGIFLVSRGLIFFDSLISILIGTFIIYNSSKILKMTSQILCDTAVIPPEEICKVLSQFPEVKFAHGIRTRGKPDSVYAELHIGVHKDTTIEYAHDIISHKVKEALSKKFPQIKYISIHIEPDNEKARLREGSVFKKKDKYSFDCSKIIKKRNE
jgi:cation diffusion facilitator family transporter